MNFFSILVMLPDPTPEYVLWTEMSKLSTSTLWGLKDPISRLMVDTSLIADPALLSQLSLISSKTWKMLKKSISLIRSTEIHSAG